MRTLMRYHAFQGMKAGKEKTRKPIKCKVCNNATYQKDCVCVVCKNNINEIHEELTGLLANDKIKKSKNRNYEERKIKNLQKVKKCLTRKMQLVL